MNSYWPLLFVFLLSTGITGLLIKPALAWGWVDLPRPASITPIRCLSSVG